MRACVIAAIGLGLMVGLGCSGSGGDDLETKLKTSEKNLKVIGIGVNNFAVARQDRLPHANWSEKWQESWKRDVKLSWRVAILPFIEETELYKQFHLNESWDSEHNKALIPLMPNFYKSPLREADAGMTYYKVFTGSATKDKQPVMLFNQFGYAQYTIGNVPDGSSNTIFAAEGGEPVIWTKPDDFKYDPQQPLPRIAHPGMNVFLIVMVDGVTKRVSVSNPEAEIRKAIEANDGSPIKLE